MSGFGDCDPNGDGLSLKEFVKYLKSEYGVTVEEATVSDVFQQIDSRGSDDERITWDEWLKFTNATPFSKVQEDDLMKLFPKIDADNSGSVSFSELLSQLGDKGYCKEDVQEIFAQTDTDDDNTITKCEWSKMVKALMAKQK